MERENHPHSGTAAGRDRESSTGEGAGTDRDRTVRETREAGIRSQGGGSSDEKDIKASAEDGTDAT